MSLPSDSAVSAAQAPAEAARASGLRYVSDQMPGIRREGAGNGFRYRYPTGDLVQDEAVLQRIKALAIPPAWQEVWICPDPAGHLQATGRDQRRRKQSRYHAHWRQTRDKTKYAHMIQFAHALPRIRRQVARDLALPGLPRKKVLATVARLLEVSLIRVGNEEYARENDSFGLTTMHNRHVDVHGSRVRFHFRGKSGKWHDVDIEDKRLAKIVRSCQELPGQELFQYVTDEGERQAISSEDVNDYLRQISGDDFTAKDFRTWAGTVLAALALSQFEQFDSQTRAKKNLVQGIEAVAERLGNTPSVCRKCYVHPEIIEAYLDGTLVETLKQRTERHLAKDLKRLRPEEAAVLALLQQRLASEEQRLHRQLASSITQQRQRRFRLKAGQ